MTTSLEEYVAKATSAYQPSANAIQQQIDALPGRLDTTTQAIEKDYAQQQANLNNLSNQAAEAASMQAAGSGGSFGGAANIANRKYYEQSFVPAVTQLKTNRSNDLAAARQANEDTRNTLAAQLANLNSQANSQALSQYYTDLGNEQARQFQALEAEKGRTFQSEESEKTRQFQAAQTELDRKFTEAQNQLNREWEDYLADKRYKNEAVEAQKVREFQAAQAELERQYNAQQAQLDRDFQAQQNAASRAVQQRQIDSSNAYNNYIMQAAQNARNQYSLDANRNLYGGYNWRNGNGDLVRVAEVAANDPGDFNDNLYQRLGQAASNGDGDWYSAQVFNEMSDGARFAINNGGSTGNAMYDTLGIRRIN